MDKKESFEKDRQRLIEIIREKSFRVGDFTLVSGKKSKYYVDLKGTSLHAEGAYLIGKLAVQLFLRDDLPIDAVGGLTLGADPIATSVSIESHRYKKDWPAFIVRKESKGHGTDQYIEGQHNLTPSANLMIVEDVLTTGASSLKAVQRARDAGYSPNWIFTVIDRNEGGREAVAAAGLKLYALLSVSDLIKS